MDNKIVVVSVSAVIVVLMVACLLIPTINGVTTSTEETEQVLKNINGEILFDDGDISTVAISSSTTWVVTTDGKLYGCGKNYSGQQGDGTTTDVTEFTQRLSDQTIASVSCTDETTWVMTTDGKLYGCGYNNRGQQGDGTTTDVKEFTQRLAGESIVSFTTTTASTDVIVKETISIATPLQKALADLLPAIVMILLIALLVSVVGIVAIKRE